MRVKIGNTVYDSQAIPICIEVSMPEQEVIASLDPENRRVAFFEHETDKHWIEGWMADFGDDDDAGEEQDEAEEADDPAAG